jgi:hypothetical protein
MAAELGGEFREVLDERPGKFGKCTSSNAAARAERAGENNEEWANATNLAGEAESRAALAVATGASGMGTCHKLVAGVRSPCEIILSSCLTVAASEVKETTQPASQSCPVESNEWDFNSGAMCTVRAEAGKPGMWISPSCVLCTADPLGLRIAMGEELMRRF